MKTNYTSNTKTFAKSLLLTLCLGVASTTLWAQTGDDVPQPDTPETPEAPADDTESYVAISADTTNISIRCRNYTIIKYEADSLCAEDREKGNSKDALTYFAGFDLGVNGFVSPSNSLSLGDQYKGFELDYAKSLSATWNFMERKLSFGPKHSGIYTGASINWNTYAFRNNYRMLSTSDSTFMQLDTVRSYTKNKLHATYLEVPLMLEFNTSADHYKSFHIAVGMIGGWKIGSNIKTHYEQEGENIRNKVRGHYNLNPFKYAAALRMGYGRFTMFATYSLSTLFERGRGPEVYPFQVGINLVQF